MKLFILEQAGGDHKLQKSEILTSHPCMTSKIIRRMQQWWYKILDYVWTIGTFIRRQKIFDKTEQMAPQASRKLYS